MLLFEEHVQTLLTVHAVLALATVALSTHLVFWLRPYLRGHFDRHHAVRRFAILSASAYAATMLLGMTLYPTYKVRVRAEYLENPSAITRSAETRAKTQILTERRNEESRRYRNNERTLDLPAPGEPDQARISADAEARIDRGAKLVRWFDVKEHWTALGVMMAAALALILMSWKPSSDNRAIVRVVFGLAIATASTAWAAGVIGLLTTAAKSVAAL